MPIAIHPSILSADFANFEREFETLDGADALHIDVMDGHFVPNLTFGLPVVRRLVEVSKVDTDIHLMIENVDELAPRYAETGATSVTFHFEAAKNIGATAAAVKAAGAKVAIALKPGTGFEEIMDSVDLFDMILIMTVEPGFGGQVFMENQLAKIEAARGEIKRLGLATRIQVDGGIDRDTIASASRSGADVFVAGSSIFGATNRREEIEALRKIALQSKLS